MRKKDRKRGNPPYSDKDSSLYLQIYMKGKDAYEKIRQTESKELLLSDLFHEYWHQKEQTDHSSSVLRNINNTLRQLECCFGRDIKVEDVDKDFIIRFIRFLAYEAKETRHNGTKPLKKTTAQLYLSVFGSVFRKGVNEKRITHNPFDLIGNDDRKPLSGSRPSRDYLTIEELQRLMATPIKNQTIKRAFLFACFTGLRISDISRLRWSDIREGNQRIYLRLQMQKTKEFLSLKLNKNALRWLPPKKAEGLVFDLPRFLGSVNGRIKTWVCRAGIDKRVSFHTSRHTFATMELSLGADLYVVSKLLGHANIDTTQIYADIIDKKRDEALDLLDTAFTLNEE